MVEFLCFTFIIMHTQTLKIKISMKQTELEETELRSFMDDVKSDPYKIQKIIEIQNKKNSLTHN